MTRRHSPLQQYKEAHRIASDHGLFIVEKRDHGNRLRYLVYRADEPRDKFIGVRNSAEGLRALVCQAANFH